MEAPKISRDTVLLVAGLAGVFFETVFQRIDRPYLLGIFGGMLGLPLYLRRDPPKKKKDDDGDV